MKAIPSRIFVSASAPCSSRCCRTSAARRSTRSSAGRGCCRPTPIRRPGGHRDGAETRGGRAGARDRAPPGRGARGKRVGGERGPGRGATFPVALPLLPATVRGPASPARERAGLTVGEAPAPRQEPSRTKKKPEVIAHPGPIEYSRQRPTLPQSRLCSTIGGSRLNFRVRNGNGWSPAPMTTGKRVPTTPTRRRRASKAGGRCQRTKRSRPIRPAAPTTEHPANGSSRHAHRVKRELWSSLTAD